MTWAEHCEAVAAGKKGFPVVEVVWYDAIAVGIEWADVVENEPCLTTTVGYLVKESEQALTLVSIINTDHVAHGITIPKPVISQRTLR